MSATIKMKNMSAMFIAKKKLAVKSKQIKHMNPSVYNYIFMKNMPGKHEWKELTGIILFGSWKFSLPVNVPPLILSLTEVSPKGPRVPRNC